MNTNFILCVISLMLVPHIAFYLNLHRLLFVVTITSVIIIWVPSGVP